MSKNEELINTLISQYIDMQLDYVNFTSYMKSKLKNLLVENDIHYQSITSRIKDIESLKRKLCKSKSNVKKLNGNVRNLNDLSGIRIIIYDRDEEKKIESLLEKFFKIEMYSSAKENYDAVNITVSLKENNIVKFYDMKCEIQIVVILSHALIEFGHDIFYKDKEELKKKDPEEYEKIKKIYEKSFEKIIQLETTMKLIKTKANNIRNGYNVLNTIIEEGYLEKIKNSDTCSEINQRIEELNNAVESLSKSYDSMKIVVENHLILRLVNAFVNIPNATYDENDNFYFGTFSYTYDHLIDILSKYIYLWKNDFEEIITILSDYILNQGQETNKLNNKLCKMLLEVLKRDKINNDFSLYKYVFEWIISNPEKQMELKMNAAIEYCNLDLQYSENDGYRQIRLCRRTVNPNNIYKENIKEIIITYSELYLKNNELEIFNKIKSMCSMERDYKEITENFKVNILLDFFDKHYREIDTYIKWELYKLAREQEKDIFYNTNIYKKIKVDKVCNLYSYLYSYFLDDITSKKHEIIENERKKYLENYIKSFKKENENEIIKICELMEIYEEQLYSHYFNVSEFLYSIGRNYKDSIKLYEETNNVYILLGIYSREDYKIKITEDRQAEKILKYEILNSNLFSEKLFKQVMVSYIIGNNANIDNYICRIIFENENLLQKSEYINKAMEIIDFYNQKKQSIIQHCSYLNKESKFVNKMKKRRLRKIFTNMSYKQSEFNDDLLLEKTFEVYPDLIRDYIRQHIKNYKGKFRRAVSFPFYECSNSDNELQNNILFCLELLKENDYYKVSEYIEELLGNYSEKVFNELKPIVEQKKCLKEIVGLLKILDVSISGWNAFELIIQNTNDEDILNEIDCILFSVMGTGEYGIANAFESRYNFFNELSKDNRKHSEEVKLFISKQRDRFRNLYQSERLKTSKRIIEEKERYNIDNKNEKDDGLKKGE